MSAERSLREVSAEHMLRSFAVNSVGPILVAKHFYSLMRGRERCVWANLSARVGSIGDNRLGGWYSYRASKAAQNQLTRTLSIELGRRAPGVICVALHPGTVETELSAPFSGSVPEHKLFSVERSVGHLLGVIDGLKPEDTGGFFDWAGERIEW
jgi:NAD(P)-dependent dehydrogenase (short-subunit alcohol dehydrogenase family)